MSDAGTEGARLTLLWLRRDLRLADNPALVAASARSETLLVVAFWPSSSPRVEQAGAAGLWWYWQSLTDLQRRLKALGSRLLVTRGEPVDELPRLARSIGAGWVVWAEGLEPAEREDDRKVALALREAGLEPVLVPSAGLLHDPSRHLTKAGGPYSVFTPFWRSLLAAAPPAAPLPPPERLPPAPSLPPGLSLPELRREAVKPWAAGFGEAWAPGERGAHELLARFLDGALDLYAADRDRPDLDGTSRLSPHLHWGELTARQVWRAVADQLAERGLEVEAAVAPPSSEDAQAPGLGRSAGAFLRQLGWREFGHHLLRHFPAMQTQPLREPFAAMPWREDPDGLEAWRRGVTGIPFVDAAMRQLWGIAWMHNRARLVAASFLTKHLLLPWQAGEAWFWDTLVDADLAANALGWQWVAGCGADAAPYFRVLNPVRQGRRYDPDGAYVREWIPELRRLPLEYVHAPWEAPPSVLAEAGISLGRDYPFPILDLGEARSRALAAYDVVRQRGADSHGR